MLTVTLKSAEQFCNVFKTGKGGKILCNIFFLKLTNKGKTFFSFYWVNKKLGATKIVLNV